jgi:beta-glucanase (GH16 family)
MSKLQCKSILFIFMLMLGMQKINAQIPVNDSASWVKQTSKCEEFNAPVDSVTKWYKGWPYLDYHGSADIVKSSNLIYSSGDTTIRIQADTLIPSTTRPNENGNSSAPLHLVDIVYQGGAMQTRPVSGIDQYKFGYLEISAKYPTGVYALWPAFWMWSASCDSLYYNEIDIAENYPGVSAEGTGMGTNIWINPDTCEPAHSNGQDVWGLPLLSNAFHKFAVQWGPDRVIWYFDDAPVRSFYDSDGDSIPQHAMAVILNFAVSQYYAFLPATWNTFPHADSLPVDYPQRFEIDYMRYYKLGTECTLNTTICTPNNYNRKVKQWIKTGGTCSPTFDQNTGNASYTLRATDYVILDAGTTINPTGTGYFAVETLECPN